MLLMLKGTHTPCRCGLIFAPEQDSPAWATLLYLLLIDHSHCQPCKRWPLDFTDSCYMIPLYSDTNFVRQVVVVANMLTTLRCCKQKMISWVLSSSEAKPEGSLETIQMNMSSILSEYASDNLWFFFSNLKSDNVSVCNLWQARITRSTAEEVPEPWL